jgi:hypothetical protein
MKTKIKYLITALSIFLFSFSLYPPDYRDSVCGIYSCNKKSWYLNSDMTSMLNSSATTTINVTKSETDSALNIITSEGTYLVKLRNNFLYPLDVKPRYYGKVINDSIYFNLSYSLAPPFVKYHGKK